VHAQLLSKDGSSLDDAEVLSGRRHTYVEGFVSDAGTPGVPTSKVRRPFLRRSVNESYYLSSIYTVPLTIASRSLLASATTTTGKEAGSGTGMGAKHDFDARGGLEIVCVRTYRLFCVSRTEDVLWRGKRTRESEAEGGDSCTLA
jgi:paired amphipathic helix protein Sin3a